MITYIQNNQIEIDKRLQLTDYVNALTVSIALDVDGSARPSAHVTIGHDDILELRNWLNRWLGYFEDDEQCT